MKKILHITAQYPGRTGSGIYLEALIREGKKRGYSGALIGGMPKSNINLNLNIPYDKFYPVIFETEKLNFPIVGMSDVMPYKSTKYSDLNKKMFLQWEKEFKEVVKRAVKQYEPDIIISHHLWLLTSLVRKMFPSVKTIALCHGTDLRQFKALPQYRSYVLEGCKSLDLILSLNDDQKQIINKLYSIPKEKIVTVGGGYNSEVFYPDVEKKKARPIRIVYAGKLSYTKGVLSLVHAYNRLKIDKNEVELLIIGSGTGEEKKKIQEAGDKNKYNIKFIEEVPQEKLGEIFRKSHIFVLPSFYEGLSLVTLEAMASGLLIVATELEGIKSFLGDEINNSGIIEYVKLPKMEKIDKPLRSELPDFEKRLSETIEKQIERFKKGFVVDEDIRKNIKSFSWENIFNKIELFL